MQITPQAGNDDQFADGTIILENETGESYPCRLHGLAAHYTDLDYFNVQPPADRDLPAGSYQLVLRTQNPGMEDAVLHFPVKVEIDTSPIGSDAAAIHVVTSDKLHDILSELGR